VTTNETTGTANPDDGDTPGTETTGTQDEQDRDAQGGKPTYEQLQALYLETKGKVEEANQLKARLAELEASQDQPPADSGTERELADELDQQLQEAARRGDPAAVAAIRLQARQIEDMERLVRGIEARDALRDIPDPVKREKVKQHLLANRNRLADVKAARAEVEYAEQSAEIERLKAELAAASKKPPSDTVSTFTKDVSAHENNRRKMTLNQIEREQIRLRSIGQNKAAMELGAKVLNGEIDTS
jgi:HAMP domain-containing protein